MAETYFKPELDDATLALEELLPLQDSLESTFSKISDVSVRLIKGCDLASVSLVNNGEVQTPTAGDKVAIDLDREQYQADAGPCLDAIKQDQVMVVEDIENETRWPEFSRAAVNFGVSSTMSVPIKIDGDTGGLNLYGRAKNAFREASRELTDLLATRASIAIENAKRYSASRHLVEQLNEAIKTREVIGEAKGILMAREGVSEDGAFRMLVTASQNTNTKLREIAQKIVDEAPD
jgi:GAF domain-containing protein